MTWLLADAKQGDHAYAATVLEAMKNPETLADVPVTWSLEVANVLARAEARELLTEAHSEAFLEMLSSLPFERMARRSPGR